ncbi:hypothetical protein ACFSUD_08315 [Sulfitobacter aestuarii]|uniref:Uncharacterized protein n=1 Tax=Sulfitobacter aestuarii TaxID=2161676 RepID=A0ABW5U2G4_9RHOB
MSRPAAPALRVFDPMEFAAPKDWPPEIGIAAIATLEGQPELHPAHASEGMAALIARLEAKTGWDFSGAGIYPQAEGYPALEVSFEDNSRMLRELERFIDDPALLEAAQDFAINFEFASEEGLQMEGVRPPEPAPPAEEPPEPQPETTAPEPEIEAPSVAAPVLPQGYVPVGEGEIPAALRGAYLQQSRQGGLVLMLREGAKPRRADSVELLMRGDRMGLAVLESALFADGRLRPAIHVPLAALRADLIRPGEKYPVVCGRDGEYLLLTPVFTPLSREKKASRRVSAPVLASALLAAFAAYMLLTQPGGEASATRSDPVGALRDEMFKPGSD